MRKVFVLSMMVLSMVLSMPRLKADENDGDKKFVVTGDLRIRWERLENYFDFNDTSGDFPGSDDAFTFIPYRARVGVSGELANNVQAVLEIQNFGSWGNQSPNQSFFFPPFQNFDGDGNAGGSRSSETSIYQAYIKLNKVGDEDLSFTLGRQEYQLGTGLILGNEDYYNGTVYDGVKGQWDFENWSLTGLYFLTSERNDFANSAFTGFGSDDQDIWGGIGSFHFGLGEKTKTHIDGYVIKYRDGDEAVGRPGWWTFGGHWWRSVMNKTDAEDNPLDWNLELAFQRGSASADIDGDGENDHIHLSGNVLDASIGYNFAGGDSVHRVHLGFLRESGDDDVTDNDFDGWNRVFPMMHGRYGDTDFLAVNLFGPTSIVPSGIQAWSFGYGLNAGDGRHNFYATIWKFKPVEDNIQDSSTTTFHVGDFGKEGDLGYTFQYSKQLSLSAGVGYLKPTRSLGELFGFTDSTGRGLNDPVTRFTLQARLKF